MKNLAVSQEIELLKIVSRRLEKAGVPYMITGSVAANLYAVPRMTRDIDIVVEMQKGDADRLCGIFKEDFYIDRDSIEEAVENAGMFNIIHNEYVMKIDFIIRKEIPYRKLEFDRRRSMEVEGIKMWIASPEDLILSKLFWAKDNFSEMQLGDVGNLLVTIKDLDRGYLEKWVKSLGLDRVYAKVKS